MRYFKAIAQENKPFIIWSLFANNLLELQKLGFEDDPLIVEETSIPLNVYDVCPLKIVSGELVDYTVAEMNSFELDYTKKLAIEKQSNISEVLKNETFEFDTHTFPMDESARLIYDLIEKLNSSRGITTMAGLQYVIKEADIALFISTYRNQLITVITA